MRPAHRSMVISGIQQNMTEAKPPPWYWQHDFALLSETDIDLIRRHSPDNWRWYFPRRDDHQCIGWNQDTFRVDKNPGPADEMRSTIFHGSGQGDPDIPDRIATPSRWQHEVDLVLRDLEIDFTLGETWWLNSWRNEKLREEIVRETTIPVVRKRMEMARERGRLAIYGGDYNHLTFDFTGFFDGYRVAPQRGLDRVFWTRTKRLDLISLEHGPKIGVGNQMRHQSIITKWRVNRDDHVSK